MLTFPEAKYAHFASKLNVFTLPVRSLLTDMASHNSLF